MHPAPASVHAAAMAAAAMHPAAASAASDLGDEAVVDVGRGVRPSEDLDCFRLRRDEARERERKQRILEMAFQPHGATPPLRPARLAVACREMPSFYHQDVPLWYFAAEAALVTTEPLTRGQRAARPGEHALICIKRRGALSSPAHDRGRLPRRGDRHRGGRGAPPCAGRLPNRNIQNHINRKCGRSASALGAPRLIWLQIRSAVGCLRTPADAPAGRYRSPAGEAMNASALLHGSLASPRCGLMQLAMPPYLAWGQNCWMSPWHSLATQAAFDSIAEQPTESSLMCASKHA